MESGAYHERETDTLAFTSVATMNFLQIHIPRHMRTPGEEGYRTPTVEDAERDLSTDADDRMSFPTPQALRQVHTSALESIQGPSPRMDPGKIKRKGDSQAVGSLGETDAEEPGVASLGWRQRIRHFTWAFFTLTMATGGIANVLYTGKYLSEHKDEG